MFKLYYNESLTASNSSFGIHVSTQNKNMFGVKDIDVLIYSKVECSFSNSIGKLVSDMFYAYYYGNLFLPLQKQQIQNLL
jgi:hypothetical protein